MPPRTPSLPPRAALFLDFDGTLVDIAPRPDAVRVPPGLPALLARLAARLDGGLAIVSGRGLDDLDGLLPVRLPLAAEHGAAFRPDPAGAVTRPPLPRPPAAWHDRAAAFVAATPGALLEAKPHGLVLHCRGAPEAGPAAGALLRDLLAEAPGDFALLPAHMRHARIGLVTPLRDGLNLVAMDYVAAQDPEDPGALVLSRFAGAARELDGALLVNPLDPDEIAEALDTALAMPREERAARWRGMRAAIGETSAARWCQRFLAVLEQRPATPLAPPPPVLRARSLDGP